MVTSLFALLAAVLGVAAAATVIARSRLRRRLRRPRLVQGVITACAAVLVPGNLVCALHALPPHGYEPDTLGLCVTLASFTALCSIGVLVKTHRIARVSSPLPRRVLAVGAHPDDLELGCGGTIAKLADSGHDVRALVMTRGERGGDSSARPGEARNGGSFLGASELVVLGFADGRLGERELDLVGAIEAEVERHQPDVILTHSGNDQHQDHRAVHLATLRAARRHSSILCYESPSALSAFAPNVFVDIKDYVEVKAEAVETHRDQRDKPYMTRERIRGQAVYRGGQARIRHAEGYEPVRLLGPVWSVL